MEAHYKYDTESEVFFIENDKINKAIVKSVYIIIEETEITVYYKLLNLSGEYKEKGLFSTKQKLLDYLLSDNNIYTTPRAITQKDSRNLYKK
jgi:hypothetical protein